MTTPEFPPLFSGQDAKGQDPFALACDAADKGCDAGLVFYDLGASSLRAAIVFAPDVPLADAAAMLPVCGVGFQNALGALAPPEVGVHLGWDGGIYLNGGRAGQLAMAASGTDPEAEPDWLVVALTLSLWPDSDDTGLTPDQTALYAEGCADVAPHHLLEAWVRHTLVGINSWADGGMAKLHAEWSGLAHFLEGQITVAGQTGSYVGLDENLGLLLKIDQETVLIPLTATLTRPA
jgi:BirA family transcriptional regulator, biotin operon repressor / biotin---[acetyl-CoA-carboxylase] ligase